MSTYRCLRTNCKRYRMEVERVDTYTTVSSLSRTRVLAAEYCDNCHYGMVFVRKGKNDGASRN